MSKTIFSKNSFYWTLYSSFIIFALFHTITKQDYSFEVCVLESNSLKLWLIQNRTINIHWLFAGNWSSSFKRAYSITMVTRVIHQVAPSTSYFPMSSDSSFSLLTVSFLSPQLNQYLIFLSLAVFPLSGDVLDSKYHYNC